MCKAYVLRFCCGHGVLMSIEPCRLGPCPILKTCGDKLPSQPFRCYNCQHKLEMKRLSNESSAFTSPTQMQRASTFPPTSPRRVSHPLQNVAQQPKGCVTMTKMQRRHSDKPFTFTCSSSSHHMTPHYTTLPQFLPHQDHPCPPCQLTLLRTKGETDTIRQARLEHPQLTEEMLIRGGCIKEWQEKPTLASYVDERVTEEREMWHHVTRKWTQDLKRCRVLVSEEDGLGLLG